MMKEIIESLRQLEQQQNICILYACESGSRAWGFPSPDSDFDVRIIFARYSQDYLTIDEPVEDLTLPIRDELDISGWDLRKALRLLRKSNAATFEWLQSPVVYREQAHFVRRIQPLLPVYFSPRVLMNHHLGLLLKVYGDRHEPEIKLKKYFYALRSLLSAMWVREKGTIPPMEFTPLLALVEPELRQVIEELRRQKSQAIEQTVIPRLLSLDTFIDTESAACQAFSAYPSPAAPDTETLNQFFRETISGLAAAP